MARGRIVSTFVFCRDFYSAFKEDGGVRLGATVAYYSLFALAPMIVLATTGASRLLGSEMAVEELRRIIEETVGADMASALTELITSAVASKYDATIEIVGFALLLWAVVVAYRHLHDSFNIMWRVRIDPDSTLAERARVQAPRIALVLLPASMLILVTLASSAMMWAADRFRVRIGDTVLTSLGSPLAMALATWGSLVILYKFAPDVRVRLRVVLVPAAAVAATWTLGTYLYGKYLSVAGTHSPTGAAGAVLLLLVWMNYTARAVLLGCWWCRWSTERVGAIEPQPHAICAETRA